MRGFASARIMPLGHVEPRGPEHFRDNPARPSPARLGLAGGRAARALSMHGGCDGPRLAGVRRTSC